MKRYDDVMVDAPQINVCRVPGVCSTETDYQAVNEQMFDIICDKLEELEKKESVTAEQSERVTCQQCKHYMLRGRGRGDGMYMYMCCYYPEAMPRIPIYSCSFGQLKDDE
jgi:hypothetical protein